MKTRRIQYAPMKIKTGKGGKYSAPTTNKLFKLKII
jgi:hypothetical protein